MTNANFTSINWNNNSMITCYVVDNNILTFNGDVLGVTLAKYNEVEQGLLKCKNRLIELGEIKVPKTQEEIIKEQSEMIETQQRLLNDLIKKMEANNGHSTANIEHDSERQTTTSDTDGSKPNKKDKSSSNK